MAAIITKEDINAFNVSNKFGFLNISDSEDEEKSWQKPKKPAKQPSGAPKKKASKPANPASNSAVVGLSAAPSQNIITTQPGQGQGLSKNAKRRARKKKQAANAAAAEECEADFPAPALTEEEQFEEQLDAAMRLSRLDEEHREQRAIDTVVQEQRQPVSEAPQKPAKKKKNKAPEPQNEKAEEEEEEEEEEDDLFLPVVDDIKDVIKRISKEDEIPITEIPIDNNQLLRKRALELQEINSEFKQKLNSLLRVGYKYKRKYQKEKDSNKMLAKVLGRCESSKKSDMVKTILQHEETEQIMTKQIEELLEELEKERSKSHAQPGEKKGAAVKKVSFSSD